MHACEWTATIITSYFYHHHCIELRCHYHLPLLFTPPSPRHFSRRSNVYKTPAILYDYLFTDENPGSGPNVWIIYWQLTSVLNFWSSGVSLSIKMQEPSHTEAFRITNNRWYHSSFNATVVVLQKGRNQKCICTYVYWNTQFHIHVIIKTDEWLSPYKHCKHSTFNYSLW